MNAVILYHANCLDGSMAALVMSRHVPEPLNSGGYKSVTTIPVSYGEPPRILECSGVDVFIVDFCYDIASTVEIARVANSVVVLDHHKTAIERFSNETEVNTNWFSVKDKVDLIFDTTKSGSLLAWEYCHRDADAPWYVQHSNDRDLWKFELEDTNEIVKGLFPYVDKLDALEAAIKYGKEWVLTQGTVLQRADERLVKRMLGFKHILEIQGQNIPSVNSSQVISELGNELAKDEPYGAVYHIDGEQVRFSLRSNDDDEDVALVAQKFGGGGHRNAAGFTISIKEFAHMLTHNFKEYSTCED